MAVVINGTTGIDKVQDGSIVSADLDTNIAVAGTFTSTGLITASAGVAIGGTGSANTLDDYEEGTWTVVLEDASGNDCGLSGETGHYTKIGNLVYVIFAFQVSSKSGVGNGLQVSGLPFTVENVSSGSGEPSSGLITFANNLSSVDLNGSIMARANNTTTFLELKYTTAGATTGIGNNHLAASNIGANTYMAGSCIYRT